MYLKKLTIKGLLNKFNHEIDFSNNGNLNIFIGENGCGKTQVLKIITYISSKQYRKLSSIIFESIKVEYEGFSLYFENNNNDLAISFKKENKKEQKVKQNPYSTEYMYEKDLFDNDYYDENRIRHRRRHRPHYIENLRYLERIHPFLRVINTDPLTILDRRKNKEISIDELIKSYDMPDRLKGFISTFSGYYEKLSFVPQYSIQNLDTNRLERDNDSEEKPLNELASSIEDILNKHQRMYSNKSQELDSSFVSDLLKEMKKKKKKEKSQISNELASVIVRTDAYSSLNLLNENVELNSKEVDIDDETIQSVITLHCRNANTKLDIYKELFNSVKIFTDIINRRLRHKYIQVNYNSGLEVIDSDTNKPINISDLSSGEQHEIYLFAKLIFTDRVPQILIIDEPEISLHITWQKSFLDDLLKIPNINNTQIFVATHSPTILGDRYEQAYELGYND